MSSKHSKKNVDKKNLKNSITRIQITFTMIKHQIVKCNIYDDNQKFLLKTSIIKPIISNMIELNEKQAEIVLEIKTEDQYLFQISLAEENCPPENIIENSQESIKIRKILDCSTFTIELFFDNSNYQNNFQKMMMLRYANNHLSKLINDAVTEIKKSTKTIPKTRKSQSMDDSKVNNLINKRKTNRLCIELKDKRIQENSQKKFLISARRKVKSKKIFSQTLGLSNFTLQFCSMQKEVFKKKIGQRKTAEPVYPLYSMEPNFLNFKGLKRQKQKKLIKQRKIRIIK